MTPTMTPIGPRGAVLEADAFATRNLMPGAVRGVRFRYASTGPHGEPREVLGVLHLPTGEPPDDGWPLIGYAHGTRGVGRHCLTTPHLSGILGPFLRPWLDRGYAFAATEYAGLGTDGGHPYLDWRTSGANVVDLARAAHGWAATTGVPLARRWLAIGGSQGGHASLAAAHEWTALVESGAISTDGLDLAGVIALAPPTRLDLMLSAAGPWVPWLPIPDQVAYVAYILAGIQVARPEVDVESVLTRRGRLVVREAYKHDYENLVARTKSFGVGSILRRPLGGTAIRRAIHDVTALPTTRVLPPVRIAQGLFDPSVLTPLTAQYAKRLRASGSDVALQIYRSNHAVAEASRADNLSWADRAFACTP